MCITTYTTMIILSLLQESGYEDILIVGTVISVMNGSWRGHRGGRFGCVHITELTVISCVPRASHFIEAVAHLKNSIQVRRSIVKFILFSCDIFFSTLFLSFDSARYSFKYSTVYSWSLYLFSEFQISERYFKMYYSAVFTFFRI